MPVPCPIPYTILCSMLAKPDNPNQIQSPHATMESGTSTTLLFGPAKIQFFSDSKAKGAGEEEINAQKRRSNWQSQAKRQRTQADLSTLPSSIHWNVVAAFHFAFCCLVEFLVRRVCLIRICAGGGRGRHASLTANGSKLSIRCDIVFLRWYMQALCQLIFMPNVFYLPCSLL